MQQNCQITRCARQHRMDSVLKSAKLRRDLTGNRNGFTHARPTLCGRVSPKLGELLGDKFANRISNLRFRHNRNTKSDSDRWSYRPVNCICTKKYTVHRGSCRISAGVEASVTWHTGFSQWRPLFVDSRRQIARSQNRSRMCEIHLSCPARPSRWVLCISMQWLRFKGCHVACDECASGEICSHQHMWVTGLSYGQSRVARH